MQSYIETCHSHMNARVNKVKTRKNFLITPVVFPVHNLGSKGGYNTPRYWDLYPQFNTGMFNTSELLRNRGNICQKISRKKSIHKYLDFDGIMFLDSAGYQKEDTTPFSVIEILRAQEKFGADLASTLDYPLGEIGSKNNGNRILLNYKNALLAQKNLKEENMLLFASVHSNDPTSLCNIIRKLENKGNFHGYALGGLMPKRYNYRILTELITTARKVANSKLIHVFGMGGPNMIPLLFYLGVDTVDSSSFILGAAFRDFYRWGKIPLRMDKLEEIGVNPCGCPICSKYDIPVLRNDRSLLCLHNAWVIWNEIRRVRFEIANESLEEYLDYRFQYNPFMLRFYKFAKSKLKRVLRK